MVILRRSILGRLIQTVAAVLVYGTAGSSEPSRLAAAVDFKVWTVPSTPSGMVPCQSWFSIGSSPDGDIFITGCDHKTNSALYRLSHVDLQLHYAGDAR